MITKYTGYHFIDNSFRIASLRHSIKKPYLFVIKKRIYMSKSKVPIFFCILISLLLISVVSYSNNKLNPDKTKIMAKAMNLQIPFIENQGQTDKKVKFYANTFAGNVYVTEKGEIVYGLTGAGGSGDIILFLQWSNLNHQCQF